MDECIPRKFVDNILLDDHITLGIFPTKINFFFVDQTDIDDGFFVTVNSTTLVSFKDCSNLCIVWNLRKCPRMLQLL